MLRRFLGSIALVCFISLPCFAVSADAVVLDKNNLEKPLDK